MKLSLAILLVGIVGVLLSPLPLRCLANLPPPPPDPPPPLPGTIQQRTLVVKVRSTGELAGGTWTTNEYRIVIDCIDECAFFQLAGLEIE